MEGEILSDYITLSEASLLAGGKPKPGSIRALLKREKLTGKKLGKIWIIRKTEFIDYLSNRKMGRPKSHE